MKHIYMFDGAQQCGLGQKVPVETIESLLKEIGIKSQCAETRSYPGFIIQRCGAPTGQCYVFEISDDDWSQKRENLRASGFTLWPEDDNGSGVDDMPRNRTFGGDLPFPFLHNVKQHSFGGDPSPWPWALYGMKVRVYQTGDVLTKDHRADRLNL